MQESWRNAAHWLFSELIQLSFYTIWDYLSRGDTVHSGLDLPRSIISQENAALHPTPHLASHVSPPGWFELHPRWFPDTGSICIALACRRAEPEDNLLERFLSFRHVGSKAQTQVLGLGSRDGPGPSRLSR